MPLDHTRPADPHLPSSVQAAVQTPRVTEAHKAPARRPAYGMRSAGAYVNDDEPPKGRLVSEEPAATYSPRPVKAKYHRRCGA